MKNELTRRAVLALSASLGVSSIALAQTPKVETADDEETVIKGGVELVNIMVTVRGKNNRLIRDLQAADFKIFEDGKEQPIRNLVRETDLPLMLGMLIDLSGSMDGYVQDEQSAGVRFFEEILRPTDRAFVAIFRGGVEMLQDVTSDVDELEHGLYSMNYDNGRSRGTALYDAVYLSCQERLSGQRERRVLVVLSDGEDFGSSKSLDDAVKAAQMAEAMIYTIAYPGGGGFGGGFGGGRRVDGDSVMKQLADETGGRIFRTTTAANLSRIYVEIEDEVRSQYSISYSPVNTVRNGKFRKIEVKMANKAYRAQARKGYYAKPTD